MENTDSESSEMDRMDGLEGNENDLMSNLGSSVMSESYISNSKHNNNLDITRMSKVGRDTQKSFPGGLDMSRISSNSEMKTLQDQTMMKLASTSQLQKKDDSDISDDSGDSTGLMSGLGSKSKQALEYTIMYNQRGPEETKSQ